MDDNKKVTDIRRMEFLNKENIHFICLTITPINYHGNITIQSCTNYSGGNSYHGGYIGQDVKSFHFNIDEFEIKDGFQKILFKTKQTQKTVEIQSSVECNNAKYSKLIEKNRIGVRCKVYALENEAVSFYKMTSINILGDVKCQKTLPSDFLSFHTYNKFLEKHIHDWSIRWESMSVSVNTANSDLEQGLIFSLYQLLAINMVSLPLGTNIPPRGLSSEYHHGHFFFNTELYMVPFYAWTSPEKAKSLLYYRLNTLETACQNARELGYKGAFWSEESDHNGYPAGPTTICNFISDEKFDEYTGRLVKHISADVCYAVYQYSTITGDYAFEKNAAKLILECARYYASLFCFNDNIQAYEILNVIGPDEYHVGVNNNFYTNYIAHWTIEYAITILEKYNIQIEESEESHFLNILSKAKPYKKGYGEVIEQFDGYFALSDWTVSERRPNGLPLLDDNITKEIFKFSNVDLKMVKQSDVVMLMSMFLNNFTINEKKDSLEFYEQRTIHESSLSLTHAGILAGNVGNTDLAWKYTSMSSRFNLDFNPKFSYNNGLHFAAYAGAWLIFIYGILGISIQNNQLIISPKKYSTDVEVTITLMFRKQRLQIHSSKEKVIVMALDSDLKIKFDDKIVTITNGKPVEIKSV